MKNRHKLSSVLHALSTNATNASGTASNNSKTNTTSKITNTNTNNNLPVPDTPLNSAIGLIATMSNITNNQTSNGTNVFQGKNNASDAAGIVGSANFSVTGPPYMVQDCNQIFLVDAERIISNSDYSKREKGLFTLSIYLANIFQGKDVNKLVESITLDKMTGAPIHIPGAPGCLDYSAEGKNILVCFASKDIADQLVKASFDFHNCRKGRIPVTPKDVTEMLSACQRITIPASGPAGPAGPTPNPQSNAGPNSNSPPSIISAVNGGNSVLNAVDNPAQNNPKMQISPYYSSLKVPGS